MKDKKCLECGSTFIRKVKKYPSHQKIEDAKRFCAASCARQYGLKKSWKDHRELRIQAIKDSFVGEKGELTRKKMAEWQTGDKAPWWKGDEATYNSKHRWIQKNWKRSGVCKHCGITPPLRKNGNSGTEWANVSGEYDRDNRKDWLELCAKCHRFFDRGRPKVKVL